jgi:two-component system sensor histidine kinase ArlS
LCYCCPPLSKALTVIIPTNALLKQKDKLLQIVKDKGIQTYIEDGQSYGSYLPLKEEYISLDEVEPDYYADTIQNEKPVGGARHHRLPNSEPYL